MWIVKLVKVPAKNDFRDGYFPRRTYYKKDAEQLAKEVRNKGGEAKVEKVAK